MTVTLQLEPRPNGTRLGPAGGVHLSVSGRRPGCDPAPEPLPVSAAEVDWAACRVYQAASPVRYSAALRSWLGTAALCGPAPRAGALLGLTALAERLPHPLPCIRLESTPTPAPLPCNQQAVPRAAESELRSLLLGVRPPLRPAQQQAKSLRHLTLLSQPVLRRGHTRRP